MSNKKDAKNQHTSINQDELSVVINARSNKKTKIVRTTKDTLIRRTGLFTNEDNGDGTRTTVVRTKRLSSKSTLEDLENEFIFDRRGRGVSQATIDTYKKYFARIYDFVGYQMLQGEALNDAEYANVISSRNDAELILYLRDVGKKASVAVFINDGFANFFYDWLVNERHLAEQSVISHMRGLRTIMYYAIKDRRVFGNKISEDMTAQSFAIHVKEKEPEIRSTFSLYELNKLDIKPNRDDFVEYRNYVIIKYLEATGNRIGTVLSLKVGDIDFEEKAIYINQQKSKKRKTMPMLPALSRILSEYIDDYRSEEDGTPKFDEYLFCNRTGQQLQYTAIYESMKHYFEHHGVQFNGFHEFRHTYAKEFIKDGGNPLMLKEILGHSTLIMTNRYTNLYGMATREEAEKHSLLNKVSSKKGRKAIKRRTT